MILLKLFFVFFKIGLFSFGGGLAMLPLMELEVVSRTWITAKEFYNIVAVAQVTPGAIAVNLATFVGQRVGGIPGSICATIGLSLPSFILMFLLYKILIKFKEHPIKISLFRGVKSSSIALIFFAAYSIGSKIFISNKNLRVQIVLIALVSYILLQNKKIHPMLILFISGVLGFFLL